MLLKWCTQYVNKFGKQQWPANWEMLAFIPIPKKDDAKECSNYHTIMLILHGSKFMLKIFQARLQQCMNQELTDVKTVFKKGEGIKDRIVMIRWIIEKAREFQKKHLLLLHWLCYNISLCGSQQTGKFLKWCEYQITLLVPSENCGSRSNSYNQI